MRLPNGYGGIVKLSGNRRRPYMVRITDYIDDYGRQHYKIIGYFAKRTEALAALTEYNNNPYDFASKQYTFKEIAELWMKEREGQGLSMNSQYTSAYQRCKELWDMPFADIKTAHYQKIINDCDKGYASKKAIKIVCNLITKYALANDIAAKNYVEFVKLPPQEESRLHVPFSPAELKTLWDNATDYKIQCVLMLCYTGLRPTELLKIKKENVFLEEHVMRGGSKTAAGKNRVIPIADKILPFIADAYKSSTAETLLCSADKPYTYDVFRSQVWEPVMNTFRMTHLPHDGRHTCATLMNDADIDAKTKKLILGHSSNDVTEKVYTHKTIEQLIEAINKI